MQGLELADRIDYIRTVGLEMIANEIKILA